MSRKWKLSYALLRFFECRPPRKTRTLRPLISEGIHYNLQEIYERLNQQYFSSELELKIGWMGQSIKPAKRSRRLGIYSPDHKSIKIHRLLDKPLFPSYFVEFIVYHEMLHDVCPPLRKIGGGNAIHHGKFKAKEREFTEYVLAKRFEKENRNLFFS